jgi:hypothetical protein
MASTITTVAVTAAAASNRLTTPVCKS